MNVVYESRTLARRIYFVALFSVEQEREKEKEQVKKKVAKMTPRNDVMTVSPPRPHLLETAVQNERGLLKTLKKKGCNINF